MGPQPTAVRYSARNVGYCVCGVVLNLGTLVQMLVAATAELYCLAPISRLAYSNYRAPVAARYFCSLETHPSIPASTSIIQLNTHKDFLCKDPSPPHPCDRPIYFPLSSISSLHLQSFSNPRDVRVAKENYHPPTTATQYSQGLRSSPLLYKSPA